MRGRNYYGVFKSTDGGATWSGSNTGLPDTYVYALRSDHRRSHPLCGDVWRRGVQAQRRGDLDCHQHWLDQHFCQYLVIAPQTPTTSMRARMVGCVQEHQRRGDLSGSSTGLTNTFVISW